MEDDEEEDDGYIPDWTQVGAFANDPMCESKEGMGEAEDPVDELGQVLRDAKEDCEKVKK